MSYFTPAMYNETVMDHFQNPRNTGDMPEPDGIGEVGNPACGDLMRLYIKVENDRLADIKCETFGCAAAIACASAASEMVMGKTLEEASQLTRAQVVEYLNGLPEQKIACSNLAPDAIRAAIESFRAKSSSGD
jgi:nitrogen fixation NifU-like protein